MSAPALHFAAETTVREGGGWRTRWRVTTTGSDGLLLESVVAPHRRYRAPQADLGIDLRDRTTFELTAVVQCRAGEEIENAFLIVVVRTGDERWRVLARFRVPVDSSGVPHPVVESVTAHRFGFAEDS